MKIHPSCIPEVERVFRAWELGRLEWKLDTNQQGIYALLKQKWETSRIHVLNCSRQLGKSWLAVAMAIEYALQHPGAMVKYAAGTQKAVRAIVRPHFRDILKDCPLHLRPAFNTQDGEYRFRNGSVITIAGCESEEKADRLLGQHAHLFIIDEAARIDVLNYVVRTIAMPMTQNTRGRIIIISTPAPTPDHPFKEYCDAAAIRGVLIERTVYDNPRLSNAEIEEFKAECGGEEATEWQREYLVRHVTDIDLAVIKSANERRVRELTFSPESVSPVAYRPKFFDSYESLDTGWAPDFTGILWGLWDYEGATLIIEDEWMMRQMDTKTLAAVLKAKRQELWGCDPYRTIGDCDERLVSDLATDFNILVERTPKDDLDTAINRVNMMVAGKKYQLRIHDRCRQLRRQLVAAIWDKHRKKFARSRVHGHYDLVAALIYMARNVHYDHIPEGLGSRKYAPNTCIIIPYEAQHPVLDALRHVFGQD